MTITEIEDLERRGWEALSGPVGATFYADLMADDGLMVFPGLTLDKRATIGAIAGARPWSWFRLEVVRVVELGDTGRDLRGDVAARGRRRVPRANV